MSMPPEPLLQVLARLQQAGHEAWLVGGAVRDRVLGRPAGDWDVATSAEPEEVMALFPRVVPTGLKHGTVTVVEGEPIEVTTFRVDGEYTDGRRPDSVRFTRSLEEDLARRDFTVNAMAWDPLADRFADPFGGRHDLDRRLIRAVGDPVARFTEDGLRPLRAVRFAAVLGFSIDPATEHAMARTLPTFRQVSVERIRVELAKTLTSPRAGWALGVLQSTGLLAEFLPEVAGLAAADFAHVVRALAHPVDEKSGLVSEGSGISDPLAQRLTLLLHPTVGDPDALLRRLRFSNEERRRVVALLRLRDAHPHPDSDFEVRALVARVTLDLLDTWLAVRATWEGPAAWQALAARIETLGARAVPLTPGALALDGKTVMERAHLPPSRRVGRVLQWLLEQAWHDPAVNTPEALTALLPRALAEVPE